MRSDHLNDHLGTASTDARQCWGTLKHRSDSTSLEMVSSATTLVGDFKVMFLPWPKKRHKALSHNPACNIIHVKVDITITSSRPTCDSVKLCFPHAAGSASAKAASRNTGGTVMAKLKRAETAMAVTAFVFLPNGTECCNNGNNQYFLAG